ncbi:hypothetical protein BJX99DRAFT_233899 [Aspergillus californicus]
MGPSYWVCLPLPFLLQIFLQHLRQGRAASPGDTTSIRRSRLGTADNKTEVTALVAEVASVFRAPVEQPDGERISETLVDLRQPGVD